MTLRDDAVGVQAIKAELARGGQVRPLLYKKKHSLCRFFSPREPNVISSLERTNREFSKSCARYTCVSLMQPIMDPSQLLATSLVGSSQPPCSVAAMLPRSDVWLGPTRRAEGKRCGDSWDNIFGKYVSFSVVSAHMSAN